MPLPRRRIGRVQGAVQISTVADELIAGIAASFDSPSRFMQAERGAVGRGDPPRSEVLCVLGNALLQGIHGEHRRANTAAVFQNTAFVKSSSLC